MAPGTRRPYYSEMSKKAFFLALSFLIIPGIGLVDQLSGEDMSLIVLYLVPIALASWQGGAVWGSAAGLLAVASWTVANIALPVHVDIDPTFHRSWELGEKIVFFALAIGATARLRAFVDAEQRKGLTDYATGLPNRRAFAADLAIAQAGGASIEVGFIELAGLEELYLERGESFVEVLVKAAADMARAAAPTYRFGDERLAFISAGMPGPGIPEAMRKLAAKMEAELLRPKGLALAPKIGIARCREPASIAPQALRKFLEGSMIFLRGKPGTQVEEFDFA